MPLKNQNDRLSCLTPRQRRFVEKHWKELVKLHPEFSSQNWTDEECRWWTSYYQAQPSELKERKSCQEYLPPKVYELESEDPLPDEVLIRAEEASGRDEETEDASDSLVDFFLDRSIQALEEVIHEERAAGNLTRSQETATKWIVLLIQKPKPTQDLESALCYGRFNINALVSQINRRARKRIVSHKTLARALDVVLQSIRRRTGKSGYIGSYQTKAQPKSKSSRSALGHKKVQSRRAPGAGMKKSPQTQPSKSAQDRGVS